MNEMPPTSGQVEILLFSVLRERIGASSLTVPLEEPATASALLDRLADSYPGLRSSLSFIRVAVNQEYVGGEHLVRGGDEIALITPVSGG